MTAELPYAKVSSSWLSDPMLSWSPLPPWPPLLIPADIGSCMNGPPDVGPSVLRPDPRVFAFLSGDDILSLGGIPLEAADFQIHFSGWTQVFPLDMAPG